MCTRGPATPSPVVTDSTAPLEQCTCPAPTRAQGQFADSWLPETLRQSPGSACSGPAHLSSRLPRRSPPSMLQPHRSSSVSETCSVCSLIHLQAFVHAVPSSWSPFCSVLWPNPTCHPGLSADVTSQKPPQNPQATGVPIAHGTD